MRKPLEQTRSGGDPKTTVEHQFAAAYLSYVERCIAIGAEPMSRDELRALLDRAHAEKTETGSN